MIKIYSIQNDTPNQKANIDSLTLAIRASVIKTALQAVSVSNDVLTVEFKDTLDAGDDTLIGQIVGAHPGEQPPEVQLIEVVESIKSNERLTLIEAAIAQVTAMVGPIGATGLTGLTGLKGDKGDTGDTGVQGPVGNDGPIGPVGPAGNAGGLEEYHYAESLAITTSSTAWIEKLKLTTSSLVGGYYLISWAYEWEVNDNMRRIQMRGQVDDSIELFDFTPEVRDDYFFPGGSFRRLNLAAGVHEIDIDFRRDNSHGSMRNVVIQLWKVG